MVSLSVQESRQRQQCCGCNVSIWVLILSNLLVFQFAGFFYNSPNYTFDGTSIASNQNELLLNRNELLLSNKNNNNNNEQQQQQQQQPVSPSSFSSSSSSALAIPQGGAIALPSIRIDDTKVEYKRDYYGGAGDKPHLGGFATNSVDLDGVAPSVWRFMVEEFGVKSLLDVGCGRGVSTSWFHLHGVDASCVEGSHDAILQSLLPSNVVTEHDFSRGPWWPSHTVDAIWCVELLEHVGRNYHKNILPSFRKAAVIFATHSTWGGWHHVEVHMGDWWIQKFESYGFKYSQELTDRVKRIAQKDDHGTATPNGKTYNAQHIWLHMMVFINPEVAALPEHHHLFAEGGHGCYHKFVDVPGMGRQVGHRPCGGAGGQKEESKIPDSFLPLKLDPSMDAAWEKLIFGKEAKKSDSKKKKKMSIIDFYFFV